MAGRFDHDPRALISMKDSAGIVLASALQLAFAVHPKYVKEVDMNDRKQSRFLNLCPLFPNLAALYSGPHSTGVLRAVC